MYDILVAPCQADYLISLGSFRFSDSSFSSRLSDASILAPSDTTFTLSQQNVERQIEPNNTNVKKRSLPTLMEDFPENVKQQ